MKSCTPNNPASFEQLAAPGAGVEISDEKTVVSLFSGCGGMDLGFIGGFEFLNQYYDRLPNRIIFANDKSNAACRTYQDNIGDHIVQADIDDIIGDLPDSCDILIGGFPCQDVSVNGKRQAASGKRTVLYTRMLDAIRYLNPSVFLAENVKGLMACDFGSRVLDDFNIQGYTVTHRVCVASDYGVPQNRERLLIVGIRGSEAFTYPDALSKKITAKEAIGDLSDMREDPEKKHVWSKAKPSPDQGSRKLKPDVPATTMRAEHHGNVQWHYELPRRISCREQARFQSFPDVFEFPCGMRETERQIGNAVPPVMVWHIAKAINEQVFF